jgi:hypothetical protein
MSRETSLKKLKLEISYSKSFSRLASPYKQKLFDNYIKNVSKVFGSIGSLECVGKTAFNYYQDYENRKKRKNKIKKAQAMMEQNTFLPKWKDSLNNPRKLTFCEEREKEKKPSILYFAKQ